MVSILDMRHVWLQLKPSPALIETELKRFETGVKVP
jgi:hypothetical protein